MPDEISRDEGVSKVVRPRFRMGLKPTALLRHTAKVRLAQGLAQNDTGRVFAEWETEQGMALVGERVNPVFLLPSPPMRRTFEVPKSRGEAPTPRRVKMGERLDITGGMWYNSTNYII